MSRPGSRGRSAPRESPSGEGSITARRSGGSSCVNVGAATSSARAAAGSVTTSSPNSSPQTQQSAHHIGVARVNGRRRPSNDSAATGCRRCRSTETRVGADRPDRRPAPASSVDQRGDRACRPSRAPLTWEARRRPSGAGPDATSCAPTHVPKTGHRGRKRAKHDRCRFDGPPVTSRAATPSRRRCRRRRRYGDHAGEQGQVRISHVVRQRLADIGNTHAEAEPHRAR